MAKCVATSVETRSCSEQLLSIKNDNNLSQTILQLSIAKKVIYKLVNVSY